MTANGIEHLNPKQIGLIDKIFKNQVNRLKFFITALSLALVLVVAGLSIFTLNIYFENKKQVEIATKALEKAEYQRKQKSQIRDLWESQAAGNDRLITLQIELFNRISGYQTLLTDNLRIYDGKIEKKDDINVSQFRASEDELLKTMQDIDRVIDQNAADKADYKRQVDGLYLDAKEDQDRRINIKDGIRN